MFNLHRQYGKITAVQNLSLGIAKGECFGLLGVNGAGKTTTFNMMTGDTVMTSGKGYLYGNDVTKQLRTAQKFIGYCPQFDAFIGKLTLVDYLFLLHCYTVLVVRSFSPLGLQTNKLKFDTI